TLNLLEVSPTFHDDYFFYQDLLNIETYPASKRMNDTELFDRYLHNYLEYAVKPYHGAMVFLGHPMYTGYNDTTLKPLVSIINTVKSEKAWITSIEKLAAYWIQLGMIRYQVYDDENKTDILVVTDNDIELKGVTLRLFSKPQSIQVFKGTYELIKDDNFSYLVFDAFNGQKIKIKY
ncbi:hypothetical protein ACFL6I_27785, partial [candidate division KSB1 bacterium]